MKAWVLHEINDMRFNDISMPILDDGEVLVKVKAAGICSSDIPRVYSTGAYHYPIILGHEFSGVTEDGRHVGVFPLLPCFECQSCKEKHYETCSDYSYIGSRQDGAFAEYVAVPQWNLLELPDSVSFEQAAVLEPAAVALHAVKRLDIANAERVAVVGSGAIGQLISKWLSLFGVITVDIFGRGDRLSKERYDACIEAVGTTDAFQRCIELTRPNGQIVLVGNPNTEFVIDQKLYWQILRKQLVVKGTWNSSYPSDWNMVLDNANKLELEDLISHRYSFSELNTALEMIRNKSEKYVKVIMTVD